MTVVWRGVRVSSGAVVPSVTGASGGVGGWEASFLVVDGEDDGSGGCGGDDSGAVVVLVLAEEVVSSALLGAIRSSLSGPMTAAGAAAVMLPQCCLGRGLGLRQCAEEAGGLQWLGETPRGWSLTV